MANLDKCDRLLVLVPGGRVAFYGPPAEALSYFSKSSWAEVFHAFEADPERDWAGEFAVSPAYARCVRRLRWKPAEKSGQPGQSLVASPPRWRGAFRQMVTLTRRYIRTIASDRNYLMFIAVLPVVLGAMIRLFPSKDGLAGPPHTSNNLQELLLALVSSACLAGAATSVREIVKERPIYVRERAVGQSAGAYLSSKLLVLGIISVVESSILVLLGLAGRPMPSSGALLTGTPLIELLLGIAVLAVASMCIGLVGSALITTSDKTVPFLVLLTTAQIILSGGLLSLSAKPGFTQLAWLAPARWGFGAVASTTNLNAINSTPGSLTDPLWVHTSSDWLRDTGCMVGLALISVLLTWVRLRSLSPGRPRKRKIDDWW